MASGQHFFGVPGESGPDDHWNDVEGTSTFLLRPVGLDSSKGSCSFSWYVRGLGDIGNKCSDCALWTLPPSYSAT